MTEIKYTGYTLSHYTINIISEQNKTNLDLTSNNNSC